jgi:branched-chain amino acid transport system ATP-binding protein
VTVDILEGERHAIIGPNGAGKSTLFHVITGRISPTSGQVFLRGRAIGGRPAYVINRMGIARNFQVTNLFGNMTVYENLRATALRPDRKSLSFWSGLEARRAVSERADEVMEAIGLAHRRYVNVSVLSYAEQRALEIGIAIAGDADVILLDEPTAGMSNHETERAIALIEKLTAGRTLVMVEHDMNVVFRLADRISVLARGEVIATDTPERVRSNTAVQEAYLGAFEAATEPA